MVCGAKLLLLVWHEAITVGKGLVHCVLMLSLGRHWTTMLGVFCWDKGVIPYWRRGCFSSLDEGEYVDLVI